MGWAPVVAHSECGRGSQEDERCGPEEEAQERYLLESTILACRGVWCSTRVSLSKNLRCYSEEEFEATMRQKKSKVLEGDADDSIPAKVVILATVMLILVLYVLGVTCILGPLYFFHDPSNFTWHALFTTGIVSVLLFLYIKCYLTEPGYIPLSWTPDVQSQGPAVRYRFSPDSLERNTHCSKCSADKPPRAHHCRHCGRCIAKMDHHCPWVGNCIGGESTRDDNMFSICIVGHRNHKLFVQLLVWLILTLSYALIEMALLFIFLIKIGAEKPFLFINGFMFFLIGILHMSLMALTAEHIMGFFNNSTTIERMEYDSQMREAAVNHETYTTDTLYDLGNSVENIKENLGSPVWTWIIPSVVPGDGVYYRINSKFQVRIFQAKRTDRSNISYHLRVGEEDTTRGKVDVVHSFRDGSDLDSNGGRPPVVVMFVAPASILDHLKLSGT
ncbi:hypothetical protein PROFUN_04389 [Planoprotostelium fungivorum]|uniref:Palmitoyltransferase n=1 Tax=Planoprotostelium fungivorum TaxID=1890364 RepID=A0A2P6NHS9_9EUKA|nr:hypothetical protein PROFUN_04389 [Planoprotostelium fungivorum]